MSARRDFIDKEQARRAFERAAARYDEVAADLSRNLGAPVTIGGDAAARRFSGVIVIDRDPAVTMERVGALLELNARRTGGGWSLAGENGAPR